MAERFGKPFLSAEWRYLAMLNYEIEMAVLAPFVPRGTELDSWQGKTFVSRVGFVFLVLQASVWVTSHYHLDFVHHEDHEGHEGFG